MYDIDNNFILCSNEECESLLNLIDSIKMKLECTKCKKSTCNICIQEYHGEICCSRANLSPFWKEKPLSVHSCPRCGDQVEKFPGGLNLECRICLYAWCKTCGFNANSDFHNKFFFALCELFRIPFKDGDQIPKVLKVLIFLFFDIVLPVVLLVFMIGIMTY